jgi:hypothetical protein
MISIKSHPYKIPIKMSKNNNLSTKWDIRIPTTRADNGMKHLILEKTGIEWISNPEVSLYYAIDCINFDDCIYFIDELKKNNKIRLFTCIESDAYRYKQELNIYGYYYVDIL